MGHAAAQQSLPEAQPGLEARDAQVLEHLHLVPAIARRLGLDHQRVPAAPLDWDDYLAAGAEALVRAAGTWQPHRGSPFVPYAWAAIAWAMRAEQRRMRWRNQARRRDDRTVLSLQATWKHDPDDPTATITESLADPAAVDGMVTLRVTVRQAVEQLQPKLREAVRLCWLQDLPQRDVADRLGITQPAVSLRLRQARGELARTLRPEATA